MGGIHSIDLKMISTHVIELGMQGLDAGLESFRQIMAEMDERSKAIINSTGIRQ